MDRLDAKIRAKGLNVFARIDHAAGAAEVGLTLAPTELIIFGNDASWIAQRPGVAGTELMIDKMADLLSAIAREAAGSR